MALVLGVLYCRPFLIGMTAYPLRTAVKMAYISPINVCFPSTLMIIQSFVRAAREWEDIQFSECVNQLFRYPYSANIGENSVWS